MRRSGVRFPSAPPSSPCIHGELLQAAGQLHSRADTVACGREDDVEQAWEGCIERLPAERVHVGDALGAGMHETRIAQHPELVRHGRFRAAAIEGGAAALALAGKLQHDAEPNRVTQRVENFLEAQYSLAPGPVHPALAICRPPLVFVRIMSN